MPTSVNTLTKKKYQIPNKLDDSKKINEFILKNKDIIDTLFYSKVEK